MPPDSEPPDNDPPESVAPLIVPKPEIVGLPEPVMLPVAVNAPMLEAEIVLTPSVPVEPLSVKVNRVFGVDAAS